MRNKKQVQHYPPLLLSFYSILSDVNLLLQHSRIIVSSSADNLRIDCLMNIVENTVVTDYMPLRVSES